VLTSPRGGAAVTFRRRGSVAAFVEIQPRLGDAVARDPSIITIEKSGAFKAIMAYPA